MKKKKLRRAPSFLTQKSQKDKNLAFFSSPYFHYVIAGTAVVLLVLFLDAILYVQNQQATQVLGAQTQVTKNK